MGSADSGPCLLYSGGLAGSGHSVSDRAHCYSSALLTQARQHPQYLPVKNNGGVQPKLSTRTCQHGHAHHARPAGMLAMPSCLPCHHACHAIMLAMPIHTVPATRYAKTGISRVADDAKLTDAVLRGAARHVQQCGRPAGASQPAPARRNAFSIRAFSFCSSIGMPAP